MANVQAIIWLFDIQFQQKKFSETLDTLRIK